MQIDNFTQLEKEHIVDTFRIFQKHWPDEKIKNIRHLAREYEVSPKVIEAVLAEYESANKTLA